MKFVKLGILLIVVFFFFNIIFIIYIYIYIKYLVVSRRGRGNLDDKRYVGVRSVG
jgi:hypothetical protein